MPRSPDLAIFVLMMTDKTDYFTPCTCAQDNKIYPGELQKINFNSTTTMMHSSKYYNIIIIGGGVSMGGATQFPQKQKA